LIFNLPNELFLAILENNVASVSLRVERQLREVVPNEAFVATSHLDLHEYVRLGHATATLCEIPELAAATEGFSFAYLKELMVSALLQWVHGDSRSSQSDGFESSLMEQVRSLQEQRKTSQAYLAEGRRKRPSRRR
jgi:hypothetical protein